MGKQRQVYFKQRPWMHKLLFYTFEKGFLTKDDLLTFEKNNSDLLGHPVANDVKGC